MQKIGFTLIALLILINSTLAGGPLTVSSGKAILWEKTSLPVHYLVDKGRLDPFSHTTAVSLVDRAFQAWEDVSTSWLTFHKDGEISEDVTGSNYSWIRNQIPSGVIPVIFDNTGDIIELKYGIGSKDYVLGLTTPYSNGQYYVGGEILFNGHFFEKYDVTQDEMYSTILHEFGHICGLDHCQHSRHLANNFVKTDDLLVPIMYPLTTDNDGSRITLAYDDFTALSNLYPTNAFNTATGRITGKVLRNGTGLPGVNVIARKASDPSSTIATTVTGTYARNGDYTLAGLQPGEYEIMVEAVDDYFISGSSVGQYASSPSDLSFRNQVRPEYYNLNDLTLEPRSRKSLVAVGRNQATSNIVINVDAALLPANEKKVVVLAPDSSLFGGAPASLYPPFSYLLDLDGSEGQIRLEIEFAFQTTGAVEIKRETSPDVFMTQTVPQNPTRAKNLTVVIGPNGEVPLQKARYFLSVINYGGLAVTYTMNVAQENPEPTATPTFTPSPTATLTFTPTATATWTATPTRTATPTSIPTDTPTSTPSPTPVQPTPTPLPLVVDLNQDTQINALDLFALSLDWFKTTQPNAIPLDFPSNLRERPNADGAQQIDGYDLLFFIEQYQGERRR